MRLTTVVAMCAVVTSTSGFNPQDVDRELASGAEGDVIERFVHTAVEPLTRYGAWRTLEASTKTMRGRMVVWTALDDAGQLSYRVTEEEGSALIRTRVLRAALEAEGEMVASGEGARGALSVDNYMFGPVTTDSGALVRVGLTPRRADRLLLVGHAYLDSETAELLRVEGRLLKRPSFWTRRVDVVRTYGRVGGVRVPLHLESVASVLVAGTSRFSMAYAYETVNGRSVGEGVDRTPLR